MDLFGKPQHLKLSLKSSPKNDCLKCWGEIFKITFVSLVVIELISLLGYLTPLINQVAFFIILLVALILSLVKLEFGLYVLLAELFIGGHGYLFSLDINGTTISIRIGLFLVVLAVWLAKKMKNAELKVPAAKNLFFSYSLLFLFIAIGVINGLVRNEFSNVFFDFNAWLFFFLVFVFFDVIKSNDQVKNILQILLAATSWLSLKTIGILFSFSHGLDLIGGPFYKWIRDTGVGEITYMTGTVFRVFFQSHLYVLLGFIIVLAIFIAGKKSPIKKNYYLLVIYLYLTSLTLIISQSRSFWVGGLAGLFILIIFAWWQYQIKFKITALLILVLVATFFSQLILVQIITGNFSGSLVADRFKNLESEAAGSSRLNQLKPLTSNISQRLIFGYGFGKELTYQSNDPRVLQTHPGGIYTTYTFEWGYLDIWLKLGLAGLAAYLILIFQIAKTGLKVISPQRPVVIGMVAGLAALLVTNIFSPYLNHPLGIGYLLLMSATFSYLNPPIAAQLDPA